MVDTFKDLLIEYYQLSIYENIDWIKFINSEKKVLQRIRENNHDKGKIVELCREIMFDNVKFIEGCHKEINYDRNEIKKLN